MDQKMLQKIRIEVVEDKAHAFGPFPLSFLMMIASLSGRKIWNGSRSVSFDASAGNVRRLKENEELKINWEDKTGTLHIAKVLESLPTQQSAKVKIPKSKYKPAMKLMKHQIDALALSIDRSAYALFLEMGLGKTAIILANAGMLYCSGKLTGLLVVAPKGVHRQWIDEQVPEHWDKTVQLNTIVWKQRKIDPKLMNKKGLTIFSINIDALRTANGFSSAEAFLKLHNGRSMMIVDESHLIKSGRAARTKAAWRLGSLASFRRIATGSPISKNIIDAWSQFVFLDVRILGHRYMTSFRTRYCIMGGWENRQIIGQRNVEEFYRLIAPHSFRLTKKEAVDLPEKIYARREYEMGELTNQHYQSLRKTFMTQFDDGEIMDVKNAAVALLRLQQIVCGYLPKKDGTMELISNERIDEMLEIIRQVEGPVVIWARFTHDIFRIMAALEEEEGKGCAVKYHGDSGPDERKNSLNRFLSDKNKPARFFVSNPAAGGTGLNLQGECRNVIYFSNSFDALHRWQSEDRTHRMGTKGSVTYFDLVAQASVDRVILGNLRSKKSISTLTLDQIRQAIATA